MNPDFKRALNAKFEELVLKHANNSVLQLHRKLIRYTKKVDECKTKLLMPTGAPRRAIRPYKTCPKFNLALYRRLIADLKKRFP